MIVTGGVSNREPILCAAHADGRAFDRVAILVENLTADPPIGGCRRRRMPSDKS